jgi:hypothetical protein
MKYTAPLYERISAAGFAVSPPNALVKQETGNNGLGVSVARRHLSGKKVNQVFLGLILLPFSS